MRAQTRCECADPGCGADDCYGRCAREGSSRLWRTDMEDIGGTWFCAECAEDALESGVFSTDEPECPEDDEPQEPEDGDYVLSPCGRLGSRTYVAVVGGNGLGEYASDEEAEEAIRVECINSQWWPNVWRMSDHGNATLVTLDASTKGGAV